MTYSLREKAEFILNPQSANQSSASVELTLREKKHFHNVPEM